MQCVPEMTIEELGGLAIRANDWLFEKAAQHPNMVRAVMIAPFAYALLNSAIEPTLAQVCDCDITGINYTAAQNTYELGRQAGCLAANGEATGRIYEVAYPIEGRERFYDGFDFCSKIGHVKKLVMELNSSLQAYCGN